MIYLSFAPHLRPRTGTLIIAFVGLISCFMLIKLILLDSSIHAISTRSTFVPLSFGTYLASTDILNYNYIFYFFYLYYIINFQQTL